MGRQIIAGTIHLCHRWNRFWNVSPIGVFLRLPTKPDRSPFLRSNSSQVGSPPAHHQQTTIQEFDLWKRLIYLRGLVTLHCLQEPVQHFDIFIFGLELQVLFERCRSGVQIAQLVIHK